MALKLIQETARRYEWHINPKFLIQELKKQGWTITQRRPTATRLSNGKSGLFAASIDIFPKHPGRLWVGGSTVEGFDALHRVDVAVKTWQAQKAAQKAAQVKQAPPARTRYAGEAIARGGRVVIMKGGR